MTQVNSVPLSSLKFGHDKKAGEINARKSGRLDAVDVLAQSIKHVGLVLPLAVAKNGGGDYYVVDGNRRLAALQQLAKEGAIPKDHPVPVLAHNLLGANAKSLAANINSLPLHPVDQYERFAELIGPNMTEADIASAFALKPKQVAQVLALGSLSPKVRAAWRAGELDGKTAEAFTLADKKRQDEVLTKLTKARSLSAWAVKRELVGEGRNGGLLAFVGKDAYEAAGGQVIIDLFGDDHVISDPALLVKLAQDAVAAKCAALVEEGWQFAATEADLGASRFMLRRVDAPRKFTKEQKARLKEIDAIFDKHDDGTAEIDEETGDALEREKAQIDEAAQLAGFTKEHKAKSGCVLFLDHDGELHIDYGVFQPKAEPKAKAKDKSTKPKKDSAGISNALVQRLSEQLNDAVAECLEADADLALAAVVAGFGLDSYAQHPIGVKEQGLRTRQGNTPKPTDFASTFAALLKGGRQNALNALAVIAARAVNTKPYDASAPLKNKGIAALVNATKATAFRKAIAHRFDAKDYFASINKTASLKAVEEAIGRNEARKLNAKPKADITKFCLANVAKTDWLPPELRTAHYNGPGKR